MARRNAHHHGGKVTRRHSTVIPAAEKLVRWLNKHRLVKRVSLGEIKKVGGGKTRNSTKKVNGGVEITVRGSRSIQKIVAYTDSHRQLGKELRQHFGA